MNNPFRLYDFPITFDPIQDDMTEEERRTLLITIIEELSNSGAGDALGSLGGANNASTKKLSEQAARLIEEHQRRHASNTAKIINDWLSIKYKWQNKLGSGASGGHVESVAAKQVMQSIDDLKHIDPHQSYVSTKRALNDVIRVGKFAGHVGTVINASIALYSGDSNKVMKTITSIFAGILGAIVAGAAATAAIGGAIAGSAVAAFVAVAVIAATASYFSGKAAEWAWDNGLGDLVNDFFDKVGLKDDIEEFFDGIGDYLKDLVDKASKAISDLWDRAKNWLRRSDPLVLDLDGDGIELVAADGAVLFDHDGNRVAEATGWVAPDDGFLVIDKNGNGLIDDGSELFGDGNPDAFHDPEIQNTLSAGIRALRRYDSNQDGMFDAADTAFGQVRVWRDLNQDGVSQANELFTLADVGIQSINLNPVSTADADVGHGNVADSTGQFTRTDGSQGNFYDMLLANNPFYRQFKDEVELTGRKFHIIAHGCCSA